MGINGLVTVYSFHRFPRGVEMPVLEPYKATRAAIERLPDGELIEGTAEDVDADDLDDHGRFVRRPTGWGGL